MIHRHWESLVDYVTGNYVIGRQAKLQNNKLIKMMDYAMTLQDICIENNLTFPRMPLGNRKDIDICYDCRKQKKGIRDETNNLWYCHFCYQLQQLVVIASKYE